MSANDSKKPVYDGMKGEPTVALSLAAGSSYSQAAEKGEVSESTVNRRMADPEYRASIIKLRGRLLFIAAGALANAAGEAAIRLKELLQSDKESIALSAARAILDSSLKYSEITDMAERIEALEQALADTGPGTLRRIA